MKPLFTSCVTTVSYTHLQTVNPDSSYDALSSVTVGAISNTYIGSGVTKKSAATYTPVSYTHLDVYKRQL